jgi:hypothetical protein
MAVDQLASADNSENLARYNELKGKANTLIGQHFKLLEIIGKLDTAATSMNWQGVRATRFQTEWSKTRELLEGWAGDIAAASQKVSDEADNYKV